MFESKKNCYIYVHYTFGIGHLQRAELLAKSLSRLNRFNVSLFYSGLEFKKNFNAKYKIIKLPAEVKPKFDSKITISADKSLKKSDIIKERIKRVIEEMKRDPPNLFITEFFPFAYIRLDETLIPILKHIKKNYPECKIICSARDYPISDRESIRKYNKKIISSTIKKYYDLILVHAPKKLSMFNKKNPISDCVDAKKIKFTGYLVNEYINKKTKKNNKNILITVGGGKDGKRVIEKSMEALKELKFKDKLKIDVIKGPLVNYRLSNYNHFKSFRVKDYVNDLSTTFKKYGIIISMAGYNTVAEIAYSGSKAIIFPRIDSYEQNQRVIQLSKFNRNILIVKKNATISNITSMVSRLIKRHRQNKLPSDYFKGTENSVKEIIKLSEEENSLKLLREAYCKSIGQLIKIANLKLIKDFTKLQFKGKIFVTGWGKSSDKFIDTITKIIPEKKFSGCIYLSLLPTKKERNIWRIRSTHPLVSKENINGSKKIINFLKKVKENDLVIIVSSGGGSAMFEVLNPDVSLYKARRIMSLLLKNNADCRLINFVRKSCSEVKDGKLLNFIKASKIVTYIVSDDVLTNGSEKCAMHVASGPTKEQVITSDQKNALVKELEKIGVTQLIPTIALCIKHSGRNIKKKNVKHIVLSDNRSLLKEIETNLKSKGILTIRRNTPYFGESSDVAKGLLEEFKKLIKNNKRPFAYICGGESTVMVKGDGKGGRIQELIAHFIKPISNIPNSIAVGFASDGRDYVKGIMGAYTEDKTNFAAKTVLKKYLKNSDTYHLHKHLGNHIRTISNTLNVGDVVILFKK